MFQPDKILAHMEEVNTTSDPPVEELLNVSHSLTETLFSKSVAPDK